MSERLDEIEAQLAGITPGPWFREYGDVITSAPDPRDTEEGYEDPRHARVVRAAPHHPKKDRQAIADATFIAAAPDTIRELLTLARRQADALEAVEDWMRNLDAVEEFDPIGPGYLNCSAAGLASVVRAAIRAALEPKP